MVNTGADAGLRRPADDVFHDLFDASPEAIFIEDEDGYVLEVNRAACRLQTMHRAELVGKHVSDLVPGSERDRVMSDFRRWISEGMATYQGYSQRPDGTSIPVVIHGTRIRYDDRPAVLLHVRDRSEEVRTREALEASENKYRLIFETMKSGYGLHQLIRNPGGQAIDYRFLDVNPAFERLTGLRASDIIGRTLRDMMPTVDDEWISMYARVVDSGESCRFTRRDDTLGRVFDGVAYRTGLEQFAVVFSDVTDDHRDAEELRKREEYNRALIQAIPDVIVVLDRKGQCLDCKAGTTPRIDPASLPGKSAQALGMDDSDFENLVNGIRVSIDSGEPTRIRYTSHLGPRVTYWEAFLARLEEDRVIAVCRDMTEREEEEKRKRQMELQMRETQKLESLGVLAGGIAHDFNNLLVGIMGNADLALSEVPAHSELHEFIEEIKKSSVRASELTHLMLAYSGRGKFVVGPLDMNRLIRETHHLVKAAVSKKINIEYCLHDIPFMEGDAAQIRQLLMNLLINAAEAIGEGEGTITVETSLVDTGHQPELEDAMPWNQTLRDGPHIQLRVSDTGKGMKPQDITRIFDPFFTTKFTGRGLGLAATLGIVRGHDGAIRVESVPEKGSTFIVVFPSSGRQHEEEAPKQRNGDTPLKGEGMILVVDDEQPVRHVVTRVLERSGFDVQQACDGAEAVAAVEAGPSDLQLILLDLTMPRMNGEEAMKAIQKIMPEVPIVLMSGYSESEATEKFGDLGLRGFLQKPFEMKVLLDRVRDSIKN